jgi:iron complex transport system substrate-binding protein
VSDPRILSLVPAATDWVTQLGLGEHLVGVTHECTAPPGVPVVVTPAVAHDATDPAGVDAAVAAASAEGRALYALDVELVRELQPTIALTQQLCDVCAVPAGQIHQVAARTKGLQVVSLDGVTLEGVLADGERAAEALAVPIRGEALVGSLRDRLALVASGLEGAPRRSVAFLEWPDPPWAPGHWVPDQVVAAGGVPTVGVSGTPSARADWSAFTSAEVLLVGPCGYGLAEAEDAARALLDRTPEEQEVWAVDADRHFSRPGPTLVEGVEVLAGLLHPERCTPPAEVVATRVDVRARVRPVA